MGSYAELILKNKLCLLHYNVLGHEIELFQSSQAYCIID